MKPPRQAPHTRPERRGRSRPNSHAAIAESPRAVAQRMRERMTATVPGADARNVVHRGEHVQPPGHPAHIQLLAGEADNGRRPCQLRSARSWQTSWSLHGVGTHCGVGQSTTV